MNRTLYEPREDSFLMEKWVKTKVQGKVLDMGCGSGILSKAAKSKGCDVLAVDINPLAVAYCKSSGIKAITSDLFSDVKSKFNWIIFNPPYLPDVGGEDDDTARIVAGGKMGYELIELFLQNAKNFLEKDGKILLLFSALSGPVKQLFKKYGYGELLLEEKPLFFEKLFVYELEPKAL